MKKLRIYLDTSVINFLFADDAPEKRDATVEFFKESKAMLEVREWKEAAWREVAHLPFREAVRKRLADSAKVAERLGFRYAPAVPPVPSAKVAEAPAQYRAGHRPTKTKKS